MDSANGTTPRPPPDARQWVGAGAVLGAAIGLLFGRVLVLDAALHGRDVLHHYWPLHEAVRRALAEGRVPGWDPGVEGGMPLLANLHAGVFYPFNLLYQWVDFPRAYAWLIAAHLFILGLGTWAWLRRWFGHPAAVGGALALVLSGPALSLNTYGPLLSSLAWTPWVLWLVLSPRRWQGQVAGTGALVALQVLGGDPMPALFTGVLAALALAFFRRTRAGALVVGGGFTLAALLAAVQELPALELLAQSVRARGGAGLGWSLHPARLFEFLIPDLFGHYLEAPLFWGNFLSNGPVRIPFLLSAYLGASAAVLALAGARRRSTTAFAIVALGLGLVLALGSRFIAGPLLASVPPFSFFRYPEKYLLLALFGWAPLVAQGIEAIALGGRVRLWVAAPAAVGLAAVGLAGPLDGALGAWLAPTLSRPGSRFALEGIVAAVSEGGALTLAFSLTAVAVAFARRWVEPARAAWLLVAVVGADLALNGQRTVWTGPLSLYREPPALVASLGAASAQHPFRIFRDNTRLEQRVQRSGTYQGMAERRAFDVLSLKSAIGTVWGLEDVSGSSAVTLSRFSDFIQALGPQQARALALYNACLAIGPEEGPLQASPGFAPLGPLPNSAAVFKVEGCVPRLAFVSRVRTEPSTRAALAAVAAPGFEVGRDAVVEAEREVRAGEGSVEEIAWGPAGALETRVQTVNGSLLVYAMNWYPGWRAQLDGQPVPPQIVDGVFIGVEVPPGAHRVALSFEPTRLAFGFWLSLIGVVVFTTLGAVSFLPRLVGGAETRVPKIVTPDLV